MSLRGMEAASLMLDVSTFLNQLRSGTGGGEGLDTVL